MSEDLLLHLLVIVFLLLILVYILECIDNVIYSIRMENMPMYELLVNYAETGCMKSAQLISMGFSNVINLSMSSKYCEKGKATVIDYKDHLIIDGKYAKLKVRIKRDDEGTIEAKEIMSIEMK